MLDFVSYVCLMVLWLRNTCFVSYLCLWFHLFGLPFYGCIGVADRTVKVFRKCIWSKWRGYHRSSQWCTLFQRCSGMLLICSCLLDPVWAIQASQVSDLLIFSSQTRRRAAYHYIKKRKKGESLYKPAQSQYWLTQSMLGSSRASATSRQPVR